MRGYGEYVWLDSWWTHFVVYIVNAVISFAIIVLPTAFIIATGWFFETDDYPITMADMPTFAYVMLAFFALFFILGLFKVFYEIEGFCFGIFCEDIFDWIEDTFSEDIHSARTSSCTEKRHVIVPSVVIFGLDAIMLLIPFVWLICASTMPTSEDFILVVTGASPGMVLSAAGMCGTSLNKLVGALRYAHDMISPYVIRDYYAKNTRREARKARQRAKKKRAELEERCRRIQEIDTDGAYDDTRNDAYDTNNDTHDATNDDTHDDAPSKTGW